MYNKDSVKYKKNNPPTTNTCSRRVVLEKEIKQMINLRCELRSDRYVRHSL